MKKLLFTSILALGCAGSMLANSGNTSTSAKSIAQNEAGVVATMPFPGGGNPGVPLVATMPFPGGGNPGVPLVATMPFPGGGNPGVPLTA